MTATINLSVVVLFKWASLSSLAGLRHGQPTPPCILNRAPSVDYRRRDWSFPRCRQFFCRNRDSIRVSRRSLIISQLLATIHFPWSPGDAAHRSSFGEPSAYRWHRRVVVGAQLPCPSACGLPCLALLCPNQNIVCVRSKVLILTHHLV